MEVTSLFQGLTSKDFSETESSDEETLVQEGRYIEHEQDEFTKEVPRVPEGQSDGKHSFIGAHEEVSALGINRKTDSKDSTLARRSTRKTKNPITERLAEVDFGMISRQNDSGWQGFCLKRTADEEKTKEQDRNCNCYNFDTRCWERTGETWTRHIDECRKCKIWSKRPCSLQGHSPRSKRSLLTDIGSRRYMSQT